MKGRFGSGPQDNMPAYHKLFPRVTKRLVKSFPFPVSVEAMITYPCVMAVNNESARVAAGHSGFFTRRILRMAVGAGVHAYMQQRL